MIILQILLYKFWDTLTKPCSGGPAIATLHRPRHGEVQQVWNIFISLFSIFFLILSFPTQNPIKIVVLNIGNPCRVLSHFSIVKDRKYLAAFLIFISEMVQALHPLAPDLPQGHQADRRHVSRPPSTRCTTSLSSSLSSSSSSSVKMHVVICEIVIIDSRIKLKLWSHQSHL